MPAASPDPFDDDDDALAEALADAWIELARTNPATLRNSPIIEGSFAKKNNLPTINFRFKRGNREYLVVGVQLTGQGQLRLHTFKKSAEGGALPE